MDYQKLLLDHLPVIEHAVRFVVRRQHLSPAEADDLTGAVHLKLVENDYEVLRRFEGRSSLSAFLITTVQRIALNQRASAWGRWRPSAEAQRRGPVAVSLERLLERDRLPFEQAVTVLSANHGVTLTAAQWEELRAALPMRPFRETTTDEDLDARPSNVAAPDHRLEAEATSRAATEAAQALTTALAELAPADRYLVKLRFYDGMTVKLVAELLGTNQRQLYHRYDKVLSTLRKSLVLKGLRAEDVRRLTGMADLELAPGVVEAGIPEDRLSIPAGPKDGPGGSH